MISRDAKKEYRYTSSIYTIKIKSSASVNKENDRLRLFI